MQAQSELSRHHFSLDQYERMVAAGILSKYDHVELIDGEVIELAPIGPRHAEVVTRLTELMLRQLGDRARVRVQSPFHLNDRSAPEPDIAVLRPTSYEAAHPRPEDAFLVIEVSDTSLVFDKAIKLPSYAQAGVAELWIVNLNEDCLELYRDPSENRYSNSQIARPGQSVSPGAFPDLSLKTQEILARNKSS